MPKVTEAHRAARRDEIVGARAAVLRREGIPAHVDGPT
jgi:hypothetical protein